MGNGGEPGKIDSHLPVIDGQPACKLAISTDKNGDAGDGLLITKRKDGALQSSSPFLGLPGYLWTKHLETDPIDRIRNILLIEEIVYGAKQKREIGRSSETDENPKMR